ncbi:hypothetical protein JOQ06_009485 [Pogonophryne albipinna]|uniref:Uncharacterized protein n=1 Tax=Pogonophryne albipinna TaxID=1090488 RepID=A0AAD6FUB6_9TELE|nr:hypothetical protein JOQ06_009482 [Pogonophryne albipinna]KAJ4947450.1 hypothetical protein JOQ06_009485 [Pogonophryne albipinna]
MRHSSHKAIGPQAADLLLSSRHLLAMSSLLGRGNDDILTDGTNGRAQPTPTEAQIPPALTQIYLTVLCAFLSHDPDAKECNEGSKATVVCTLGRYRSELCELNQLAWRDVEESRILFMKEDISLEVFDFSIRTGLFSQVTGSETRGRY